MKNLDEETTTHHQVKHSPGIQPWGKMQQGRSRSAGHSDLGQEVQQSPPESQGALQVGIVQIFPLRFRSGAGIIWPLPQPSDPTAVREP